MKWKIILFLMGIIMVYPVVADIPIPTYRTNQIFSLPIHLTNSTGDVLGANCSLQIRQSNFTVILDATENEIGNGFYNYTYNTSDTGTYFCRQNCTLGDVGNAAICDFIIAGDEKTAIAITIGLGIIIALFVWLSMEVNYQPFKWLFISLAVITGIILISIEIFVASDFGLSSSINSLLKTTYTILINVFYFVGALGIVFFLVYLLKGFLDNKKKNNEGNQ